MRCGHLDELSVRVFGSKHGGVGSHEQAVSGVAVFRVEGQLTLAEPRNVAHRPLTTLIGRVPPANHSGMKNDAEESAIGDG